MQEIYIFKMVDVSCFHCYVRNLGDVYFPLKFIHHVHRMILVERVGKISFTDAGATALS